MNENFYLGLIIITLICAGFFVSFAKFINDNIEYWKERKIVKNEIKISSKVIFEHVRSGEVITGYVKKLNRKKTLAVIEGLKGKLYYNILIFNIRYVEN